MVLTLMLQEKAKEVEEADAGAAVARACGVMYEQVNRRFWAVSHDTCPSSLSSATPLFSELAVACPKSRLICHLRMLMHSMRGMYWKTGVAAATQERI